MVNHGHKPVPGVSALSALDNRFVDRNRGVVNVSEHESSIRSQEVRVELPDLAKGYHAVRLLVP
jgi:hypothetical protein